MQDQTTRYFDAIRRSHKKALSVVHNNLVTATTTTLCDETGAGPGVEDGQVTIDATSNVRRALDLTLPTSETTWNTLDTVGGELTVKRAVIFDEGGIEWCNLGVFIVDQDQIGYGPGDTVQITGAPDRWGKVQKNGLPPDQRASVPSNKVWQEIQRLVEGAWSVDFPFPGWAQLDKSATDKVGSLLYDGGQSGRESAILQFCKDNALEVFFDATGLAVLRPIPQLTDASVSVWTVDAGVAGVLLGADRTRDRTKVANAIIVTTSATDVVFDPVEVKNTTSGDPLSVNGPLGYQPMEYSSPTLRNSAQAKKAGLALLNKTLGVAKQLSLSAVQNDALDAGDVITALLPKIDRNTARPSEVHIIDTITVPLAPSGEQELATRSTRPDTDGT